MAWAQMINSKLVFLPVQKISDIRGVLSVLEMPDFETKRFFWIKSLDLSLKRGGHGHKECTQILFAVSGEIELEVISLGKSQKVILSESSDALLVPPGHWVEMKFKDENSILGVLADRVYEENDYILSKPN
jgi:dTDP-4-dehydrorhamnose 3,5-epimerase-like enzyme